MSIYGSIAMAKFKIRDSQVKYQEDKEKRPLSKYEMINRGYNSNLTFTTQEQMRRSAVKEFSYGSRYSDVQEVSAQRRRKYGEMGPQVFIPPQDRLYNGAMVWTRDYRSPVDAETLYSTKVTSDADLSRRPAHILSVYSNPTREEKRFEIYQFEEVSDKIYGKPVSAAERKKAAFAQKRGESFPEGLKDLGAPKQSTTSALRSSGNIEDKVKLDLLERGMTVEPGNRFGSLFIARDSYERDPVTGAKLNHSDYSIAVIPESSEVPYWTLTGLTRVTKATGKGQYIIAIVADDGKVRYVAFDRIGGGKNGPRNNWKVRKRLQDAGVEFKRGFWNETNKNKDLRREINNHYFGGPSDFHLSKEERKKRWSAYKDEGKREFR
jgi:hypothetical protein